MKKNILDKLKAIAAGLPEVYEKKPLQLTGAELIERKIYFDGKGKKILNNSKTYTGMFNQKVDHVTKLKAEYKRGGDAAVSTYSVNAVKKHSEQNKEKPTAVNVI